MQYHISDTMKTMQGSAIREMFKTMAKPGIISFAGGNPDRIPAGTVWGSVTHYRIEK